MHLFGRSRKTSGAEDQGVARLRNESGTRSRAASFDVPQFTTTQDPRRWSEKPAPTATASSSTSNGTQRPLKFDRGAASKPPTLGPSPSHARDRSSSTSESLFARSKNKLFRRTSNASRPSLDLPTPDPPTKPSTPTFDIRPSLDDAQAKQAARESEQRALAQMRDDAARSIGMTPPPTAASANATPSQLPLQKPMRTHVYESAIDQLNRENRAVHEDRERREFRPLPPFPCTWGALESKALYKSPVHVFQPPTTIPHLFAKTSNRNWKSRYLVLSMHRPNPDEVDGGLWLRTDTLHIFKGSFPQDEEIDRLHLTVLSTVAPAGLDVPEAGGRDNVLHISGFMNGATLENSMVVAGQETTWLFQAPDEEVSRTWALKLEAEILHQRNAVNAIARNFPNSKVAPPTRTNSVRHSKLLIHKRPVENIPQAQEHPSSSSTPLRQFAHEKSSLSHGRSLSYGSSDRLPEAPSPRYPTAWGDAHPSNYFRPLPLTPSSPPLPAPERTVTLPYSKMISMGSLGYDKPLDRERVITRFRPNVPEPSSSGPSRTSGRASPRPESPSLPPPPRSRRGTVTSSPTKMGFTPLGGAENEPQVADDSAKDAQGEITESSRTSVSQQADEAESLRNDGNTRAHRMTMASAFGEGAYDAGPDDSGQNSRTRSSSTSSREPPRAQVTRSNSRRAGTRDSLPPMPPPPRGRPPDAPTSPSSAQKDRAQMSSPNGSHAHSARSRKPSMQPSTTFGGGSDQGTPPPSVRASAVGGSSQSMRSQLSNGTSKSHFTYDAAHDGRSSRNGSASAVGLPYEPSSQPPHPFASPRQIYSAHGPSEWSDPPSRTSLEHDRRLSQRASTLPPPRPAPSGALPPTPVERRGFRPQQDVTLEGIPTARSRPPVSSHRSQSRRVSAPPAAYRAATAPPTDPPPSIPHDSFSLPPAAPRSASLDQPPSHTFQATSTPSNANGNAYPSPRSASPPNIPSDGDSFIMPASHRSSMRASTAPSPHPRANGGVSGNSPSTANGANNNGSPLTSFLSFDTPGHTPHSNHAPLPPTSNTIRPLPVPAPAPPPLPAQQGKPLYYIRPWPPITRPNQ